MICTRWGDPCEVVACHGKHGWSGNPTAKLVLLSCRRLTQDNDVFPVFGFTLKADGGIDEIDAAIDAAPEVALIETELRKAIRQAE